MILSAVDLYRYTIRFKEPIRLKDFTLTQREGTLIRLTDQNGTTGWGEAAPLPGFSPESLDQTIDRLRTVVPRLLEPKISASNLTTDNNPFMEHARLIPPVRFGLEMALFSLGMHHQVAPFSGILAGNVRETVTVNGLISGSAEEAFSEAWILKEAGYRVVKMKVGAGGIAEDVGAVRAVADVLGGEVSLRLDANRAWEFEEAMEFGRGVSGVRIGYVEEPLKDAARLPELVRLWGLPVGLDESLVGMRLEDLEEHAYARAVVIKPTLLGGISGSLRFARRAGALGMAPVVSSAYESGVGTGALVALGAAIGDEPVGLDTYRRFSEDVLDTPLPLPAPEVGVAETMEAAGRVAVEALEPLFSV